MGQPVRKDGFVFAPVGKGGIGSVSENPSNGGNGQVVTSGLAFPAGGGGGGAGGSGNSGGSGNGSGSGSNQFTEGGPGIVKSITGESIEYGKGGKGAGSSSGLLDLAASEGVVPNSGKGGIGLLGKNRRLR